MRQGGDERKFRTFRCLMLYPVLSVETIMWLPLPDKK